jgi:hypothetical protein
LSRLRPASFQLLLPLQHRQAHTSSKRGQGITAPEQCVTKMRNIGVAAHIDAGKTTVIAFSHAHFCEN